MKGTRAFHAVAILASAVSALGQQAPESPAWRLLRASEEEQVAATQAALGRGLPPDDGIASLMISKPSLVLPLIETRIECVLKSDIPTGCFTEKDVDPNGFVVRAAWGMANTGSEQALVEIAKLIKLDEKRFAQLVEITLNSSKTYAKSHNPFVVAYSGFAIGDPTVDRLITAWAEKTLSVDPEERTRAEKAARGFGPTPPPPAEKMKHLWAEAVLDHYGYLPTGAQWAADPIASRLTPRLAESLRNDVLRFTQEAIEKRIPK